MTIFEKIVKGEIPSHKVWEDQDHFAFLDIRPVAPGHTLVIPKKPIDPLFNMNVESYQKLCAAVKKVADLLKQKLLCDRVCMAVIGFEVPHAHVHLIPARSTLDFPWPGGKLATPDDLNMVLARILDR